MSLFSQEELERINKVKETNDKLEDFFSAKRENWNTTIEPLFKSLSLDFSNPSNHNIILDTQSLALSYRQRLNEEINSFLTKRSRETSKNKVLRQQKFMFYATGFGVKTNLSEKGILIDGHLAENDRQIEQIENYITYLRDSVKNLESLGFAIKNMIELLNYFSK